MKRIAPAAALFVAMLVTGPLSGARADVGFEGGSFSQTSTPTGTKRAENVLWWNDGSWWAVMWDEDSRDFHIFRLDRKRQRWADTDVAVDKRGRTQADVVRDGKRVYVATHGVISDRTAAVRGSPSYLYRFSYDGRSKKYRRDSGFPVRINNYKTETLVIDKDSKGKLWATWQQNGRIYVSRTRSSDRSWGTPFALPVAAPVDTDDGSAIVAFGNKVGVMWSDQKAGVSAMYFATHEDADPATRWEGPSTVRQGPREVDDHIGLKADAKGRVYAAIKTSAVNPFAVLSVLAVRDPASGLWTTYPISLVADCPNRTIVVIDPVNRLLRTYATYPGPPFFQCSTSGGAIYEKDSPLEGIAFPNGRGTPVIEDSNSPFVHNVSASKQNVTGRTDIVLLAVNMKTKVYWHSFQRLG